MIRNINVGVLGHVDAGKTTLCKALSSIASTAAFDKNPQSKERGISLDLGFSALRIQDLDEDSKTSLRCDQLQFTFVDCPGHASLIRTVIGGAQIINFMLLVIDVQKGLQAQTLECLVIARITCPRIIIVLNKIDKLEPNKRDTIIAKMSDKFRKTFSGKGLEIASIIPVVATESLNLMDLRSAMIRAVLNDGDGVANEDPKPFLFSIDHCFTIRGKGTICTGTVLQGEVKIGDEVEIPQLSCKRTIKSIEMFRLPLERAARGDRLGLCITQFDAKQMERGLICSPGSVPYCHCAIIDYNKVDVYRGDIRSKMKFHVHVGHATVLATIRLIKGCDKDNAQGFKLDQQYEYCEDAQDESLPYYVIVEFEKPILWISNCLLIASKLDLDGADHGCRLAFHGRILAGCSQSNYRDTFLSQLRVYRTKSRSGSIQRVVHENEIIVEDFFKKNSNREIFMGLRVALSSGQTGRIESTFGKTSKVKISLDSPLRDEDLSNSKNISVNLNFNKLLFAENKRIFQ